MKIFRIFVVLICLGSTLALAQTNLYIENAYIRELPPTAQTSAVYMQLKNEGSHLVRLISVSSDAANSSMLHRSVMKDGMMTMEHVMGLEIPAGETISFEPGGLHIMLSELKRSLRAGDSVDLSLTFSTGLVLKVTAPIVRNPK